MDEGLTFQRLKFRLDFDIIADLFHNGGKRVADLTTCRETLSTIFFGHDHNTLFLGIFCLDTES